MQINVAIDNTISVVRVKEVCEFVEYHRYVKCFLLDILPK